MRRHIPVRPQVSQHPYTCAPHTPCVTPPQCTCVPFGPKDIKRQVLSEGALQPVINLLSSPCAESQREAALLLGQFATTDNGADGITSFCCSLLSTLGPTSAVCAGMLLLQPLAACRSLRPDFGSSIVFHLMTCCLFLFPICTCSIQVAHSPARCHSTPYPHAISS